MFFAGFAIAWVATLCPWPERAEWVLDIQIAQWCIIL
jgi:hypothetical protein